MSPLPLSPFPRITVLSAVCVSSGPTHAREPLFLPITWLTLLVVESTIPIAVRALVRVPVLLAELVCVARGPWWVCRCQ